MNKFIEMRRQLSQSPLGSTLCEWIEEKRREYSDIDNLKNDEDFISARHVSRVLKEIIKELKVVDTINKPVNDEYA